MLTLLGLDLELWILSHGVLCLFPWIHCFFIRFLVSTHANLVDYIYSYPLKIMVKRTLIF